MKKKVVLTLGGIIISLVFARKNSNAFESTSYMRGGYMDIQSVAHNFSSLSCINSNPIESHKHMMIGFGELRKGPTRYKVKGYYRRYKGSNRKYWVEGYYRRYKRN